MPGCVQVAKPIEWRHRASERNTRALGLPRPVAPSICNEIRELLSAHSVWKSLGNAPFTRHAAIAMAQGAPKLDVLRDDLDFSELQGLMRQVCGRAGPRASPPHDASPRLLRMQPARGLTALHPPFSAPVGAGAAPARPGAGGQVRQRAAEQAPAAAERRRGYGRG